MSLNRLALVPSLVAIVGAGLAVASCNGGKSSDAPPQSDTATAPATEKEGDSAWDKMSKEDKTDIMKKKVRLPTMKPAFAAVNPKDFSKMNCVTCHGDGAKDKSFKMPNPKLPKLPGPDDAVGWQKLEVKEAKMVKFMRETVVPQMAAIIGEPPYDPKTGEGFGCFECHTHE